MSTNSWGGRDSMVVGLTTACAITTKVVSLNPVHCEVYSVQYYVIRLATGRWFSPGTLVYSTNTTDRLDVIKILLKVALSTITLTLDWFKLVLLVQSSRKSLKNKVGNHQPVVTCTNCISLGWYCLVEKILE